MPSLDGKPARETCACSCPEGLAGSGAELLNARLACVEARCDLTDRSKHRDASVVQLPGPHLIRVVVTHKRQGVPEVARLLQKKKSKNIV